MQHITSLREAALTRPSVVTIGAFDGVHRGHQYLIRQLIEHAQASGQVPVVLTFYPHPEMVLRGFQPGYYLTLPDAKAALLGELGVEIVVTQPFNDEVRHVRAAQFVDDLLAYLKMASLWVGADFAMGYQREGNVEFLARQGQQRGFEVRVIDLMDAGGERVSSSRIRQVLADGQVAKAAHLLGRPYSLPGNVVEGAKRGRTIGIPTANLAIPVEQVIPRRGVYAAFADVKGQRYQAVVNIGLRPTFDGAGSLTVEAHLLDFSGDVYGELLTLHFIERLRDEQKFDGIDALIAQIHHDIQQGRSILAATSMQHYPR